MAAYNESKTQIVHMFDDDDPVSYVAVDAGNKVDYALYTQHLVSFVFMYQYRKIQEFTIPNTILYANNYKTFGEEIQKIMAIKTYDLISIPKHSHWKDDQKYNKKYNKKQNADEKQDEKSESKENIKLKKLNDYDYQKQKQQKSDYHYQVPQMKICEQRVCSDYEWNMYVNYCLWWEQTPEFKVMVEINPKKFTEIPKQICVPFKIEAKTMDGTVKKSNIDYVDTNFGVYGDYKTWDANFTTYVLTVVLGLTPSQIVDQEINLLEAKILPNSPLTPQKWIFHFLCFYQQHNLWPTISLKIEVKSKSQMKIIEWINTFNLNRFESQFLNISSTLSDIVAVISVTGLSSFADQLSMTNDEKSNLTEAVNSLSDTNVAQSQVNDTSLFTKSLHDWLSTHNLLNYKEKLQNMSLSVKDIIEWSHASFDVFANQLEITGNDKETFQTAVIMHPYFSVLSCEQSIAEVSESKQPNPIESVISNVDETKMTDHELDEWLSENALTSYKEKLQEMKLSVKNIIEWCCSNLNSFAEQLQMNDNDKAQLQQAVLMSPYFSVLGVEKEEKQNEFIMIISWLESNLLESYKDAFISNNISSVEQMCDFAVINFENLVSMIGIHNNIDKNKFKDAVLNNAYYIQVKQAISLSIPEEKEQKEQKEQPEQMPQIPNDFFVTTKVSLKEWIESLDNLDELKQKCIAFYDEWMRKLNNVQHIRSLINNNAKFEKKQFFIDIKYENNQSFQYIFPYFSKNISVKDVKEKLSFAAEYFNVDQLELSVEVDKLNNDDNFVDILMSKISEINEQKENEEEKNNEANTKFPKIELKWKALVIDLIIKDKQLNKCKNTSVVNEEIDDNTALWQFLNSQFSQNYNDIRQACLSTIQTARQSNEIRNHIRTLYNDHISAIHLYTGSWLYRQFNRDLRNKNVSKWDNYAFQLIMGLKQLPFYWGKVYRGRRSHGADFEQLYRKDNIICWDGFSSTSLSESLAVSWAGGDNNNNGIVFEIISWSGRHIEHLSKYKNEKEVLLAASSHFKVVNVERRQASYIKVFLEEVPMPWCKKAVLWVDDRPEGNKKMMEDLEKDGMMVVPRTSTKNAIDLFDYFKLILQRNFNHFRIVTDMTRIEDNGKNYKAGAELIAALRERGYDNLVCIYCGKVSRAKQSCLDLQLNMDSILITTSGKDVLDFCTSVLLCVCGSENQHFELKKIQTKNIHSEKLVICDECGKCIQDENVFVHYCSRCNFMLCFECSTRLIKQKQDPKIYDVQSFNLQTLNQTLSNKKYIMSVVPFCFIVGREFNFQIGQNNTIQSAMISIKQNLGTTKQNVIGKIIALIHFKNDASNENHKFNVNDIHCDGMLAKIVSIGVFDINENIIQCKVDILKKINAIKLMQSNSLKCKILE